MVLRKGIEDALVVRDAGGEAAQTIQNFLALVSMLVVFVLQMAHNLENAFGRIS